jgi:excisionase family DNA binding protein
VTTEPRFLTVDQAARQLRVTISTVRTMIARGELTAVRVGKHLRIPVSEIDRVLQ